MLKTSSLLIVFFITLNACTGINKLTKENVDKFCKHSKEHRDIIMLGLTDDMFEPHSIHVHCNKEYGIK